MDHIDSDARTIKLVLDEEEMEIIESLFKKNGVDICCLIKELIFRSGMIKLYKR